MWSSGGDLKGGQTIEVYRWPSSGTVQLGPEITSASWKIISICLGQQSWLAGASTYWKPAAAQPHRCTSPPSSKSGGDIYLSTHIGRKVARPINKGQGLCC